LGRSRLRRLHRPHLCPQRILQHTATHCNTLQQQHLPPRRRRLLQYTATHCNTLQQQRLPLRMRCLRNTLLCPPPKLQMRRKSRMLMRVQRQLTLRQLLSLQRLPLKM